jgi:ferredoxin
LQVIDGKARLISDLCCDGLGACIGTCPVDAIAVEEREAEPYDERKVMANIVRQGPNVVRAHLTHLREHGATEHLGTALAFLKERGIEVPAPAAAHAHGGSGCPGARVMQFETEEVPEAPQPAAPAGKAVSRLRQWPVQITLVPSIAPFLQGADLVLVADCVPFAYPNLHEDFLKDRAVLVGCPKLDDVDFYVRKLAEVFKNNDIRSIEVVHMEVPCCFGLVRVVQLALQEAGTTNVPLTLTKIGIKGQVLERRQVGPAAEKG